MSCLLYTNNTTGATLAANAQIPFGSTIHRRGRAATLDGNEIVVRGGCNCYAKVEGVANVAPTAEGEVTVTVFVDGVSAQTMTVTAGAAGDSVAIPFTLAIKGGCCGLHRLTVGVDVAVTLISFPVIVETF